MLNHKIHGKVESLWQAAIARKSSTKHTSINHILKGPLTLSCKKCIVFESPKLRYKAIKISTTILQ